MNKHAAVKYKKKIFIMRNKVQIRPESHFQHFQ